MDLLDQKTLAIQNQLIKAYQTRASRLLKECELMYLRLPELTVAELYKQDRYYKLIANINKQLQKLGAEEIKILDAGMRELFEESARSAFIDFALLDNNQVEQVINQVWCSDGELWSNRIWTQKTILQQSLTDGLLDCVITGADYRKLNKVLSERFDVSLHNSERITRTELNRIYNKGAVEGYKQAGFTRYKYIATHDGRTCEEDAKLDGQIFTFDEAKEGINFPPMHPNCRCTIIADRSELNNAKN